MALDKKNFIAQRVAREFNDGDVINLGIGLPTLVANYIPEGVNITFQSENGILGVGPAPPPGMEDKDIFNAGGLPVTVLPGAMFIDSAMSFAVIRGGHVAATVLGALQVDEQGNLANWTVPGKKVTGMGGAMDLVAGAKEVIIAMEHTAKGSPKILKECTFPLTGAKIVKKIITDMCVMLVTPDGLVMTEIAPDCTVEDVRTATEADFVVAEDLRVM